MELAILNKVKKSYGNRDILYIEKFEILDGDRIGIVGRNGSGKTTLIKCLIGEIDIDEGERFITDSYSYISQIEDDYGDCTEGKIKSLFAASDKYNEFLSGGEKIKIKIVNALSENKNLIIADEPTSNLDSSSIEVLENMLESHNGSLILISHDREFLDCLCNYIVEIDDGKIKRYKGNYTDYINQKKEERKIADREYHSYIKERERLEKAILKKEGLRDRIKKAPKGMGKSEAKTIKMGDQKGKKNIDNNIKNIKSRINHLDIKEKPKDEVEIIIKVKEARDFKAKIPVKVKDLKLTVGDKVLIEECEFSINKGDKVAIIGENGCGKSTLLKEIIKNDNDNIKISKGVEIGYFDQSQKILDERKSVLENVKVDSYYDESFIRSKLNNFGFKGEAVNKEVDLLSGGERVKVSLCKILLCDNNLLILDEPTNYLDIKSMEALESALVNTDKTIILVSHDRKFISNICNKIIEIKDKKINKFDGNYKELKESIKKRGESKVEKHNKDEILVLENKISEVISMLSIETDVNKKEKLDNEYNILLKDIKKLKEENIKNLNK